MVSETTKQYQSYGGTADTTNPIQNNGTKYNDTRTSGENDVEFVETHHSYQQVSQQQQQQQPGQNVTANYPAAKASSSSPFLVMDIDNAIERLGMGLFQMEILLAAGLCFAADAMEVLLLSFLAVILKAEWRLEEHETDTIISIVFAGAMIGTLILSPLGDIVGRRPVFTITAAMIAIFGVGTAYCPTYSWLLLARFLVGFGVGGLTVPFDTLAEFVPTSHRGTNLLYIEFFWTGGTLLVPIFAWVTLSESNSSAAYGNAVDFDDNSMKPWQEFVILCSIPCILSTFLGLIFVPESPRWLLTKGRHDEALAVLRLAAKRNGYNPDSLFPEGIRITTTENHHHHHDNDATSLLEDSQVDQPTKKKKNNGILSSLVDTKELMQLFSPKWRKTILLLWGVWSGLAFLYYGVIIAVSIVFSKYQDDNVENDAIDDFYSAGKDDDDGVIDFDYSAIFISASSEVFGLILVLFTVDSLGRVKTQTFAYIGGGISTLLLGFCAYGDSNRGVLIFLAFLARMFMMGASCTTWVSTSEILSTEIRATGHGTANAMARLGGFFCPYIITEATSLRWIGIFMVTVSILTAKLSWQLPETAGKALGDIGEELDHDKHNTNTSTNNHDESSPTTAYQGGILS